MSTTLPQRYLALDVFRGLTLALMIIVNTPGSSEAAYAQLDHAAWHGFTLTDLVFPSFLFVVGTALSLTMKKFAGLQQREVLAIILKRGALIFLCGYLLYWFPFITPQGTLAPFADTRIMGVLQRIGLCYACGALIVYYGKSLGAAIFCVAALLLYWLLMARFGDYSMLGNAGILLDKAVLGERHMYHGEGVAFDPEGLLGTLPSIVNVLAGYFAGRYLQNGGQNVQGVLRLLAAAAACVLVALCWNSVFPINKKLWTSAFVVCTVGLDLLILAALVAIIDLARLRRWTYFFEVFGKNTLFIYIVADVAVVILARLHADGLNLYTWIYRHAFASWASPVNASLLFAVCYMLACWSVAYAMDKKRLYIKL